MVLHEEVSNSCVQFARIPGIETTLQFLTALAAAIRLNASTVKFPT